MCPTANKNIPQIPICNCTEWNWTPCLYSGALYSLSPSIHFNVLSKCHSFWDHLFCGWERNPTHPPREYTRVLSCFWDLSWLNRNQMISSSVLMVIGRPATCTMRFTECWSLQVNKLQGTGKLHSKFFISTDKNWNQVQTGKTVAMGGSPDCLMWIVSKWEHSIYIVIKNPCIKAVVVKLNEKMIIRGV